MSDPSAKKQPTSDGRKTALFWASLVGTATAVVGAITGVVPLFHAGGKSADGPGAITVTSSNQSGGITAGVVNLGPPQRTVDATVEGDSAKHVPLGSKVSVCSVADSEAQTFAASLSDYLKSRYKLRGSICTTVPNSGGPKSGLEYMKLQDPTDQNPDAPNDTVNIRVLYRPGPDH